MTSETPERNSLGLDVKFHHYRFHSVKHDER